MTLTDEGRALLVADIQKLCCPRVHGCEVNDAAECTAQRVKAALLSAARQASTLEPGEGWEPIETARRNGEEVLVWGRSIGRQIASAKSVPRHEPYEWPSGWDFPTGATHWRPLPAPPASQIKEG